MVYWIGFGVVFVVGVWTVRQDVRADQRMPVGEASLPLLLGLIWPILAFIYTMAAIIHGIDHLMRWLVRVGVPR